MSCWVRHWRPFARSRAQGSTRTPRTGLVLAHRYCPCMWIHICESLDVVEWGAQVEPLVHRYGHSVLHDIPGLVIVHADGGAFKLLTAVLPRSESTWRISAPRVAVWKIPGVACWTTDREAPRRTSIRVDVFFMMVRISDAVGSVGGRFVSRKSSTERSRSSNTPATGSLIIQLFWSARPTVTPCCSHRDDTGTVWCRTVPNMDGLAGISPMHLVDAYLCIGRR